MEEVNKNMERKLLYYDWFEIIPRHYDGERIIDFIFKDVKTGEDFVLGSCYYAE